MGRGKLQLRVRKIPLPSIWTFETNEKYIRNYDSPIVQLRASCDTSKQNNRLLQLLRDMFLIF